jgi:hypothetical protein
MAAPLAARPSTAGAMAHGKRSEESVCVAVNIRPLIDIELDQGCQECLFVTPGLNQVCCRKRWSAVLMCCAFCTSDDALQQPN